MLEQVEADMWLNRSSSMHLVMGTKSEQPDWKQLHSQPSVTSHPSHMEGQIAVEDSQADFSKEIGMHSCCGNNNNNVFFIRRPDIEISQRRAV